MAAFTEGFTDTSGQKDHIGAIISKVLAARQMAEQERNYAQEQLQKQDPDASLEDFGIKRGYFFKKALAHEFGGDFVDRKRESIRKLIDKRKLLKDPKALKADVKGFLKQKFNQKLDPKKVDRFRSKFDYNLEIKNPFVTAEEESVPSTAKKTARSASGSKGVKISREELLASVSDLAKSLEKTAESIAKNTTENAGISSSIQSMNQNVVAEISQRTSTLENKLDAIAAAINNQTAYQKQSIDKAEDVAAETRSEKINDSAGIVRFDDLSTKEDESLQVDNYNQTNVTVQQSNEQENIPQAEKGGIISGPDSGYNVRLHGNEMIIPLDNNYTQGEPSAVDGMKRPKPKFEMGTVAKSPAIPKIKTPSIPSRGESVLGGKVGFKPLALPQSPALGTAGMDKLSQPLMDAMSLPMMVAGGTVLSATSKFMTQLGPAGASIAGEIGKVSRPIADIFGLPNTIAAKSTAASLLQGDEEKDPVKKEDKKEKKGMFSKILTTLNKVFNNGGGGGGGGGGAPPGDNTPGDLSASGMEGLANLIGSKESGNSYTKLVGGAEDESIMDKTVSQLQTEKGGQFAMGRYQFQMRTAEWLLKKNGIDPTTFKFDKSGQDKLFELALKNRGLDDYLSGKMTEAEFMKQLAMEWRALPEDERGLTFGDQYASRNKAHATPEQTLTAIRALKVKTMEQAADPNNKDDKNQTAQSISQNFGFKTHEKLHFTHNNERYHGYKTANGWDIYKEGVMGGVEIDTAGGRNAGVVKALVDAGTRIQQQRNIKPPEQTASALNNNGATKQTASALTPASKSGSDSTTIATLPISSGSRSSNASTSSSPTSQNALAAGRAPALDAYYNPNSITA